MADPGFPVGGGVDPLGGGVDLRRGCFSAKMYVKMKEFGPVGGVRRARPPRSANVFLQIYQPNFYLVIWDLLCSSIKEWGHMGYVVYGASCSTSLYQKIYEQNYTVWNACFCDYDLQDNSYIISLLLKLQHQKT